MRDHLSSAVDRVYVHNDGSDPAQMPAYWRVYDRSPEVVVQHDPVNRGVAHAKNELLQQMLDDGADWLFLCEDDMVVRSPEAVTGYIRACQESGWHHLSYAHHGAQNGVGPVEVGEAVTLWPHYVGSWSCFTRDSLCECGLLDEGFTNAWEHIEHTLRLALSGYTDPRAWHAADATGSEAWVGECEAPSCISGRPEHDDNVERGHAYWRTASPETFELLWPR